MTRYLISFDQHAMDRISADELPRVAADTHAVVEAAQKAGVWIFGGGLDREVKPVVVAGDGKVADGDYPVGGMCLIEVPSHEAALEWAAKFATACRCPQEVNAFMYDPLV